MSFKIGGDTFLISIFLTSLSPSIIDRTRLHIKADWRSILNSVSSSLDASLSSSGDFATSEHRSPWLLELLFD